MKKKVLAPLALLLSCALLAGCVPGGRLLRGAVDTLGELSGGGPGDTPHFEDIAYTRPDLEALRADVEAVKEALDGGKSLRDVTALLDACYVDYYHYYTLYNLADIRACQDMTDEFYAGEFAWCDENYAAAQQLMEDMYYACGMSDRAQELEDRYFWEGFAQEYGERSDSALDDTAVELMRRESALLSRYRALTASPTIQIDGRERDYNDYLESVPDQESYDEALTAYYEKYNGELSEIYIEMVKVRRELAEYLGFDSYEQMQYLYYFERDYSPEQAAAYIADIKEHMAPLYVQVMAEDPYGQIDYGYLSESRLLDILGGAAERMGGQIEEAFDFMAGHGFYDIAVSPVKAPMSFESYLTDYEAPFLFLDPYGDIEDVLSFAHEFGHYTDAYVNADAYETIDLSECFSQAMEYLLLSRGSGELTQKELDTLFRLKMLDTLELYIQQASFAEFEHEVYAADPEELSAEFLNALSLRLARDYGYYDGVSEDYYAMSWTDIVHFFEMPFYVITYPVSNDAAMQIYELERAKEGAGLEKYLELLPRQYEGLMDSLAACGLESPFAPGRVERVARDLRPLLEDLEQAA